MLKNPPPLRFEKNDQPLHAALNAAAQTWLEEHGEHRLADAGMIAKMLILLALGGLAYALCFSRATAAGFVGCYFVFITAALLLAINVIHDASHNAFLRGARANRLLNMLISLPLGMDPECWRIRHVIFHHPYTNVQGYDLDIEENGVLRQTPFQRWKPFMRWQRFYWPLVAAMTFPTIIWVFDWQDRAGLTPVGARMHSQGWRGWAGFLLAKAAHVVLSLGLPLYFCADRIGAGTVVFAYFFSQTGASLLFVLLILGTHWAKGKFFQAPPDGAFAHGRYEHQFATTFDWKTTPDAIGYWLGGMNMHLTHHLFPDWSHRHYVALGGIIARIAPQYGIRYDYAGLGAFMGDQQRFLTEMGQGSEGGNASG
jgi:linoleoyl-CoA desaturase